MKYLLILITALTFISCGTQPNTGIDTAFVQASTPYTVKYTSSSGIVTETHNKNKYFSVAPSGFINVQSNSKITVILSEGNTEVKREWSQKAIRVHY